MPIAVAVGRLHLHFGVPLRRLPQWRESGAMAAAAPTSTASSPCAWPSRLELQSATFEYTEAFYNRQRRHFTLDMLSPANLKALGLSPLGGESNGSNRSNEHQHQPTRCHGANGGQSM
jgi:transposase InsO family protein